MEYKSPLDMLYHWEKNTPDKVFLRQPVEDIWHTWTWKEAADEVRRMAAALLAMHFPDESNIAIISKNCAHWILCDLAIMMAGHVSVPLYPNLNAGTIKHILEHSDCRLVFVGKLDDWHTMKAGVPDDITCISFPFYIHEEYENWEDIIKNYLPLRKNIKRSSEEMATIIYTSGTTGKPKGVVHTYHNFSFTTLRAIPFLGFTNKSRFFSYLPLSHSAERTLVEMGSIYSGGQVFFTESVAKFAQNLAVAKPTEFLGVHRIWKKIQQRILAKVSQERLSFLLHIPILSYFIKLSIKRSIGLAHANNIFTGAAPTPVDLIKWFDAIGIKIQEGYAMTENCCYSHITQRKKIRPGFVGQPFPGVEVKLDWNNEILIRHEALMTGYYKDPGITLESFTPDGFLRTGDEGFIDRQGFLKITGRVKDIFKTSKGNYVAPSPIEMKISGNSVIDSVCVVGTDLPQPIALITLSESGKKKTSEELQTELHEIMQAVNPSLDIYEKVEKMVVVKSEWTVENGMLTPSFKIKRNEVEKKYASKYQQWQGEEGMLIMEN